MQTSRDKQKRQKKLFPYISYLPGEKLEHDGHQPRHHAQPEVQRQLYQRGLEVVGRRPQRKLVVEADLGHQRRHHGAQEGGRDEGLAVVVRVERVLDGEIEEEGRRGGGGVKNAAAGYMGTPLFRLLLVAVS